MSWVVEEQSAVYQKHGWKISVDLNCPRISASLQSDETKLSALTEFVKVDKPILGKPEDCYVRWDDLVTTHEQTTQRPFSVQFDHRLIEISELHFILDLWISVQTFLLDSHPRLDLLLHRFLSGRDFFLNGNRELVPDEDDRNTGPIKSDGFDSRPSASVLGTPVGNHFQIAAMIHPSDLIDVRWREPSDKEPSGTVRWSLLGSFMEKGVIRRLQMRFCASQTPFDPMGLSTRYRQFMECPLPLTT